MINFSPVSLSSFFHPRVIIIALMLLINIAMQIAIAGQNNVDSLWVVKENVILKYDASQTSNAEPPQLLKQIPTIEEIKAIGVDNDRGFVWAVGETQLYRYDLEGTLKQTEIIVLPTLPNRHKKANHRKKNKKEKNENEDHDDDEDDKKETDHDGHESDDKHSGRVHIDDSQLEVNPEDGSVWLSLENEDDDDHHWLMHYDVNGQFIAGTMMKGKARALSLDVSRSRLWVATKQSIVAYAFHTIDIVLAIALEKKVKINDLTYDPFLDQLWVVTHKQLRRYDPLGTQTLNIDIKKPKHIAINGNGNVWVTNHNHLLEVDHNGSILWDVEPFANYNQSPLKHLVVNVEEAEAWVANNTLVGSFSEEGHHRPALWLDDEIEALALYIKPRDKTPPVIHVNYPSTGDYINTKSPLLSVIYSDEGDGVDTSTIQFHVNGTIASHNCILLESTAECTLNTPLPEGDITLSVIINDLADNIAEPHLVHFTVDTISPQITITAPEENLITNQPSLMILGKINEAATLTLNNHPVVLDLSHAFNHGPVALQEGVNMLTLVATDLAGNTHTAIRSVRLDTIPPAAIVVDTINISDVIAGTVTVTGQAGSVESGSRITLTNLRTGEVVEVFAQADGSFEAIISAEYGDSLSIVSIDAANNNGVTTDVTVSPLIDLPPDPSTVAPPLSLSEMTNLHQAASFLYTGDNPIQTHVSQNAIDEKRVAVLRGLVKDRDNSPLSGVTITIKDETAYGQTLSRLDGWFDLVVNGGESVTVNYSKEGFLPVQRKVYAPWRDFVVLPDVVLVRLDAKVTTIDLSDTSVGKQVAQSTVVVDEIGQRQSTLLFASGTKATMVFPGGSTTPLTQFNVRATEYTVGPHGPASMPGVLPASSAYTYAAELSIDEAIAAGAKMVTFDKPVINYVEDFIGFPVGLPIPVGYYEPENCGWEASQDGRVIRILSINNGLADIDINGLGISASASERLALGMDDAERQELATLYTPGQRLWRVRLQHFSTVDYNYPQDFPEGIETPDNEETSDEEYSDQTKEECGSIIDCRNQVLGEVISIAGTNFSLNYRSDRVPGRMAAKTLRIPLMDETLPPYIQRIDLEVGIAGKTYQQSFTPEANLVVPFTWDGLDAYGRVVQGAQRATIRIGYVYESSYQAPVEGGMSFGLASGESLNVPTRTPVIAWQSYEKTLGVWNARGPGLGGWTANIHHQYDPIQKVLFKGNGRRVSADNLNLRIETIAGTGVSGFSPDSTLARDATLNGPTVAVTDPEGNLIFVDAINYKIRKINLDGTITTIAGNGQQGQAPDGSNALESPLAYIMSLAIDKDGSIVYAEYRGNRVMRVTTDGVLKVVAGNGTYGYSGDGGLAVEAQLNSPHAIAIDENCNIYVTDFSNNVVRRIDCNGIITTVAGNGIYDSNGDNGSATQASLMFPSGIAIGNDGSLYISEFGANKIRKVSPGGIISLVAGNGLSGDSGNGGPAIEASINRPPHLALGPDGALYFTEYSGHKVKRVTQDGIIQTMAGTGQYGVDIEGIAAAKINLARPHGIAFDHNGGLLIVEEGSHAIRRISLALPGYTGQEIVIPSSHGQALYEFDKNGRHLRTKNAVTAEILYAFSYDQQGNLKAIIDADGNITQIERDPNNELTAIVSPDGLRTTLTVNDNGYISEIVNPNKDVVSMTYLDNGLMTRFSDANGNTATIEYDEKGRLLKDTNAAGGFWSLTREEKNNGYVASISSALNRIKTYTVNYLADGGTQYLDEMPDGTITETLEFPDGQGIQYNANGTQYHWTDSPDPRLGLSTEYRSSEQISTPQGLQLFKQTMRSVTGLSPVNSLIYDEEINTTTINGRIFTSTFNKADNVLISRSAEGREQVDSFDLFGKLIQRDYADFASMLFDYDERGRLKTISHEANTETRITHYTYPNLPLFLLTTA